jgi:endonuclease-3
MPERAFDIDLALARIAEAVKPYPPAAMFELADAGYRSVFEQVIACLLSVRTRDEVSVKAAPRLFAVGRTPEALAETPVARIAEAIKDVTFAPRKAEQIQAIARRTRDEFGGVLPCEGAVLQSMPGIGPKCTNLTLGVACGVPVISVDIHVHRVTNRWGYVQASTPEKTMLALQQILPERHHIEINRLLVPFGKHVCTGVRPSCSTCPVRDMCARVGVTEHR